PPSAVVGVGATGAAGEAGLGEPAQLHLAVVQGTLEASQGFNAERIEGDAAAVRQAGATPHRSAGLGWTGRRNDAPRDGEVSEASRKLELKPETRFRQQRLVHE